MTADARIHVICKDEPETPQSQHHGGRVKVIGYFERHDARWFHMRDTSDSHLDKGSAVKSSLAGTDREAPSLATMGVDPSDLADLSRRYDGLGDDIVGRRLDLECRMCGVAPNLLGTTLVPIFETLARHGREQVTLRALAARLSKKQ